MLGLVAASFLAATLVPLSSELALYGYLALHPANTLLAVAVATLGNTAGGMTTYFIGRCFPARAQARLAPRALAWLRRYGAAATVLAWAPLAGDALCLAAGWLRVSWIAALAFSAAGRLTRYLVVVQIP